MAEENKEKFIKKEKPKEKRAKKTPKKTGTIAVC